MLSPGDVLTVSTNKSIVCGCVYASDTVCICSCMLYLSSVFLFIPKIIWPFVYPPDEAALHVAVVSTLWRSARTSSCVLATKWPCLVVVLCRVGRAAKHPGDKWPLKSLCQHRQPPTVSRGALMWLPPALLCFLWCKTFVVWQQFATSLPLEFFLGVSWFKQGWRLSWNTHAWLL